MLTHPTTKPTNMTEQNDTGTLISIEGIDGSGKSTVIGELTDWFDDPVLTSEPNEDQWLGRVLRESLSREDMDDMALFFLFLAEHAQHVANVIQPALNNGELVITDRYIDSRYAYQTPSLDDVVDGDTFQWIETIQENGWSRLPDKTIYLDVSVDTALERIADNEKEVFEKRDRLEDAKAMYDFLAFNDPRFAVVNAEREPDIVAAECAGIIENTLERTVMLDE